MIYTDKRPPETAATIVKRPPDRLAEWAAEQLATREVNRRQAQVMLLLVGGPR